MALLEIKNLRLKYKNTSKWNLQNINLKAEQGELLIVAGASGSGKSTLAQAILGIIPDFINAKIEGEIRIEGQKTQDLSRKSLIQFISYVPQYPADFVTALLVEEEISFPLENLGIERKKIQQRLKQILAQLNITHLQYRLTTELSAGELQRVALATALATSSPILILDEPMARIDPKTEILIAQILRDWAQKGHLVLAFEHRLDYLLPLADRIVLLEEGEVIAEGRPRTILDKLKGVDLPEVSQISASSLNKQPLDLEEARSMLVSAMDFFSESS
ncbi:MAG: energy-coupling factor ABC transporter ATP-binding protein [Promethearchaeota archaeon]